MKTQIPRSSDQPDLRYSGVYEQLGRMIDAADWNELVEILKRHFAETLTDAVGSGAPRDRGLAVIQDAPAAVPKIRGGIAYADGVFGQVIPNADDPAAIEFDFGAQHDFQDAPALPANIADLRFYVDIWERTILAIEDEELMDPGLHGADTCTRTQTMAQVKWCPAALDPESESNNPKIGSALLDLTLREPLEERDDCDPCAAEVDLDLRVGNYLFRLEVHDVVGDHDAPSSLTLKWSVENAAEQHVVGNEPEDYKIGNWVYEFYSTTDDRHLGLHHVSGFSPHRGVLLKEYPIDPTTDPATSAKDFVRRWDGYLTLDRSGTGVWSIALDGDGKSIGIDNGIALVQGGNASEPGFVALGSSLDLNVATLDLNLGLEGVSFLAGDYWLGMVREAIHKNPESVDIEILAAQPPLGIVHHYLLLGATDASGDLNDPADTDRWRRLNFPPLTDLQSYDVGYGIPIGEEGCLNGLFTSEHDTVKKALDRLCDLAAEHIGYTTDCPSGLFTADHDTVKKALDQVCQLQATHVGYQPSEDCDLLKDATTVWEALDILCKHDPTGGGGCKVTVGLDGGQFSTLREAFDSMGNFQEACICLLPGVHVVKSLTVSKPRIVCITGCGEGTRLDVSGSGIKFEGLVSLDLEGINFDLQGESILDVRSCTRASIASCSISGTPARFALLNFSEVKEVMLEKNHLEGLGSRSTNRFLPFVGPSEPMVAFFTGTAAVDTETFAKNVSKDLARMDFGERKEMSAEIQQLVGAGVASGELSTADADRLGGLTKLLDQKNPRAGEISRVLESLDDESGRRGSSPVLQLHDASVDATLTDNRIEGTFLIYDGSDQSFLPGHDDMASLKEILRGSNRSYPDSSGRLSMTRNEVTRLSLGSSMTQQIQDVLRKETDGIAGAFSNMLFTDNTLAGDSSRVLGVDIALHGNLFLSEASDMGSFLSDRILFLGNFGSSNDMHGVHSFSRGFKPTTNLGDFNYVFIDTH